MHRSYCDSDRAHKTIGTEGPAEANCLSLRLSLGERLDVSALSQFQYIERIICHDRPRRVFLDMGRTHQVFDSGLALLVSLREQTHCVTEEIALINCDSALRERLIRAGLESLFSLA